MTLAKVGEKRGREDVEEVRASASSKVVSSCEVTNREELLRTCAVFRVMNGAATVGRAITLLRRSDVVEVLKCKFGPKEVAKAVRYFKDYFTTPLTKLRFQAWLASSQEIALDGGLPTDAVSLFAKEVLSKHASSLRTCDLSRNRLTAVDVPLVLGQDGLNVSTYDNIEVLDLSYNPIGNAGAIAVLEAIKTNRTIRAVILKHCGIDDEGCGRISEYLRSREKPTHNAVQAANAMYLKDEIKLMFFINLNGNRIGGQGTRTAAYKLPDHVSITMVGQQPALAGAAC